MRFALGCAFNMKELFLNYKRKFKVPKRFKGDKKGAIIKVFTEHVKDVIDDIIDNNTEFILPTGKNRLTVMKMRRVDGESFKRLRKAGKFRDIDFLTTNFAGYEIVFEMFYADGRPRRRRTVYVDGKRKKRITDNANNGKQYY